MVTAKVVFGVHVVVVMVGDKPTSAEEFPTSSFKSNLTT